MVATIQQIIATINPNLYYATSDDPITAKKELADFKALIEKEGFQKAAEQARPKCLAEHTLEYDSSSETLEPIYFFILELMQETLTVEKIADNFTSAPGSGHFAELGQRATIMQQQGAKLLGDVNTVLRSVLNLIYDLKEFRIRLQHYDDLKTDKKDAAILALKQIWMDKVDIQKQQSSIKAMALGQAGFQTLINAFLASKTVEDIDKLDLNEMVKRILKPRLYEFNSWLTESEKELRKRYELEKTYLRSQVNSLKLYSRWAKPYLKAAKQLEGGEIGRNPAIVKTFNTILLELTLLGKTPTNVKAAALEGTLPEDFANDKFLRTLKRKYYSCILVDFVFRGIPQRVAQQPHYVFGGKAEVTFRAYALNDDELKKLNEEIDKADVNDALGLIEGATTESLEQLQEDINFFLEDKTKEKEKSKNFLEKINGLLSGAKKEVKKTFVGKTKKKKKEGIAPDSFIEKEHLRPLTGNTASAIAFNLFDIYKKGHGMPSYT